MMLLHFISGRAMRAIPQILLILIFSSYSAVFAIDLNIYEKDGRVICGMGSKEYRDSLVVLHLKGNPVEIGYQYGRLMSADILEALSFWNVELPAFALHAVAVTGGNALSAMHLRSQILPNLESHLPPDYALELRGTANALRSGASFSDLAALQASYDLYQFYKGVTVGADRMASRTGNLIVGKNTDSFGAGYLNSRRVIAFYEPSEGIPYVTVNPPGMTGATDGMNMNGLVVCFSPMPVLEPGLKDEILHYDGIPVTVLLREVLQRAGSFDEAVRMVADAPRTRGGTVFLADAASGRLTLLEFTPDGYELFAGNDYTLWCTDHYRSGRFADGLYGQLGESYLQRYRARDTVVADALVEQTGKLDLDAMIRLLRLKDSPYLSEMTYLDKDGGGFSSVKTLGSLVFMPDQLQFWVAGTRYLPATANRYTGFSLNNEFGNDDYGSEAVETVPPADRTAGQVFRSVQHAVRGDSLRRSGRYTEAVRMYERALDGFTGKVDDVNGLTVREKLADTRRDAGDFQGAFQAYTALVAALSGGRSTIKTRELRVRVLVKSGMLYDEVGLHDKAREHYRQALTVRDIYSDRWQRKAREYLEGGAHD